MSKHPTLLIRDPVGAEAALSAAERVAAERVDEQDGMPLVVLAYTQADVLVLRGSGPGEFESVRGKAERETLTAAPIAALSFEIRAFTEDFELRWLRRGESGSGCLISERTVALEGWLPPAMPAIPWLGEEAPFTTIDAPLLLWGDLESREEDGWTSLTTPQIGRHWVPFTPAEGVRRIALLAREYLASGPQGNVYVAAERLVGFRESEDEQGGEDG